MNVSHNEAERKLGLRLQQLVTMLRLDSGQVRMDVHQGAIVHVDVAQRFRIPIGTHPPRATQADDKEIATRGVDVFVRNKLQPLVRNMAPFGRIVAKVEAGSVAKFHLVRKCRRGAGQ